MCGADDPNLEQQARELLAAEYEKEGWHGAADDARSTEPSPHCACTIRAIVVALSQQRAMPEPFAIPADIPPSVMQFERGWNSCLAALAGQQGGRTDD